jgi:hypothetical protein
MRTPIWRFLLAAWMLGSMIGCGYHLQGAAAPKGTIEVLVFDNHTVETGIEAIVTDQVVTELRKTPGWTVVPPGQGRYVLRGTIVKFVSDPHLLSEKHVSQEQRATLILDVRFQDRTENKDLWRDRALRTFADYPVGRDVLANERQKLGAIARIAAELASRIRVHIQDTW